MLPFLPYLSPNRHINGFQQQGVATILIVLLVGISMTALSLGVIHSVKSTQHKQAAVHATAHVQPLAWAGVEIFRSYLETLDKDQLEALTANKKISISLSTVATANAFVNATLLNTPEAFKEGEFTYYRITTAVTAFDKTAGASSTLKAVYDVAPAGGDNCLECIVLDAILDFHDNLSIDGGITVKAPAGGTATFNVDGNVDAINVSLTSINKLHSTGNIVISAGTFIDELFANGNISIMGSAGTTRAAALGTITMADNTKADTLHSNTGISLSGIATVRVSLDTLGSLNVNSVTAQGTATTGADILVPSGGGSLVSANAVGTIDIANANYAIPTLRAKSNIACPSTSWSRYTSITTEANAVNCPPVLGAAPPNIKTHTPVSINLMAALQPFTMPKPLVDVWQLQGYANYLFTREGTATKVLVKNVNGVDDGNYFLGDYPTLSRGYKDFLCKAVDANNICTDPASPSEARTICYGHTTSNDCLNYDDTTKTWLFNGKSFAPGVMWFEGNLELGNGTYYNTFLATGNLHTADALTSQAPNFAGFASTCQLNYPTNKNTTGDFIGMYPVNLCDITGGKMIYNAIGNLALAAGGTAPEATKYSGGNVDLGDSNSIGGTVLAGEHLTTNGSTTVRGYVSATSQSGKGVAAGKNAIGGSTSILLDNLPAGYRPEQFPPMDVPDDTTNNGGKGLSKLVWARHI